MEQRMLKMHDMQTRSDDNDDLVIEGYFAVYGDIYNVWEGATESIAPGAFSESISGDVRALYNHDDSLILGRTSAGTLTLRDDSHGLWGSIKINRNDTDAMNAYERIKRGDVTGLDAMKKRKLELRKQEILKRIRGENDGNQSTDAEEEN